MKVRVEVKIRGFEGRGGDVVSEFVAITRPGDHQSESTGALRHM